MADGMGSGWVPRRRNTDPSLRPQHAMEARMLIDIYTERLAADIDSALVAEFKDGPYYRALNDLRGLVNLPALELP